MWRLSTPLKWSPKDLAPNDARDGRCRVQQIFSVLDFVGHPQEALGADDK